MIMNVVKSNQLPVEFPRSIRVVLVQGEHRGRSQLYAYYDHSGYGGDGRRYKLVMKESRRFLYPKAGEEWQVSPVSSSGTIVFCELEVCMKVCEGDRHPIYEKLEHYLGLGVCEITIDKDGSKEKIRGKLNRLEVTHEVVLTVNGSRYGFPITNFGFSPKRGMEQIVTTYWDGYRTWIAFSF